MCLMRGSTLPALMFALLATCAGLVICTLLVFLFIAKPTAATPDDDSVVAVSGLQYEAMLGRRIRPANAVDAPMVAGLSARDRHLRSGQILFGAFIAVANDTLQSRPATRRIALRDATGQLYRPLSLPSSNPYAYVAKPIPPKTRIPGFGTPAADNLAATGKLLLFRIPAARMADGPLELVIHDARVPHGHAELDI